MSIDLVTRYLPYVDEIFATESKKSMLTNQDFSWTGAKTVKIYKVGTSEMNDYGRNGAAGGNWSRYGQVKDLNAEAYEMTLMKDRSFTFVVDTLDEDETGGALTGATALARQQREVIIPEVDAYTYWMMCEKAGNKPEAVELTADNIYEEITKATETLDNAEVPETDRVLLVTPATHRLMKECDKIIMNTEIAQDMKIKGVIANLDGAVVVKVPASRLPEKTGFMLAHPCATVAPTKLESYKTHKDPPGYSGTLVEGRICYDAFVLDNKANAIYVQKIL